MDFEATPLAGVWVLQPAQHRDSRGVFQRVFCRQEFAVYGLDASVAQTNLSRNTSAGTLRGFHYQLPPHSEAKTMTCITGSVYIVVVDLRPDSQTFLAWTPVELQAESGCSLHLPAGCANAFLTLQDDTVIYYCMSAPYCPEAGAGFCYDDPQFDFRWPIAPVVISEKDRQLPNFDAAGHRQRYRTD